MPIRQGNDIKGVYYKWGNRGKKYYYLPNNLKSRNEAWRRAHAQGVAIYASGWQGKN